MWLCGGISSTALKFSFLAVQLSVLGIYPTFFFQIPFKQEEGSVPCTTGQSGPTEVCVLPSVALLRAKGHKWILLTETSNPLLPLCHRSTTATVPQKKWWNTHPLFLIAMFQKAEGLWQLLQRWDTTIFISHAIQSRGEEWWLQMLTSMIRTTHERD